MKFVGTVDKHGHLEIDLRELIASQMRALAGSTVTISITKFVRKRSDNQNRFFHGPFLTACVLMYHDAGNIDMDDEAVKEDLKELFGLRHAAVTRPDGTVVRPLKSTADYTTIEMEDFMEKLRSHFAPFGYSLPFPNENES